VKVKILLIVMMLVGCNIQRQCVDTATKIGGLNDPSTARCMPDQYSELRGNILFCQCIRDGGK
jgi:hypothetical protein